MSFNVLDYVFLNGRTLEQVCSLKTLRDPFFNIASWQEKPVNFSTYTSQVKLGKAKPHLYKLTCIIGSHMPLRYMHGDTETSYYPDLIRISISFSQSSPFV